MPQIQAINKTACLTSVGNELNETNLGACWIECRAASPIAMLLAIDQIQSKHEAYHRQTKDEPELGPVDGHRGLPAVI